MNASIEDALIREIQKDTERKTGPRESFIFSMMGRCPRAQVGIRAGVPPVSLPDDRARYKMWLGSVVHRAMQRKLLKAGYLDPKYTAVGEDGMVTEASVSYRSYRGHPDGVASHLPCGLTVLEIKSCDDRAVKYDLPENAIWQGFGYCLAVGAKNLQIFQIGLSQGLRREVVLPLTSDWVTKLEVEIGQMEQFWKEYQKSGALPDCSHRFTWEDRLCPFLDEPVVEKPKRRNPYEATEDEKETARWLNEQNAKLEKDDIWTRRKQ